MTMGACRGRSSASARSSPDFVDAPPLGEVAVVEASSSASAAAAAVSSTLSATTDDLLSCSMSQAVGTEGEPTHPPDGDAPRQDGPGR